MNLLAYISLFLEGFFVNPMNFIANLKYMGLGMLCIFIVIGIIAVIVVLLEKFTAGKKNTDQ